jgi:hypothetical protein
MTPDDEYTLNPTGSDEEGWDYGDASPDDDLDNADWPKQTPDTQADLDAAVAALPPSTQFIHGSGWYAWFDYDTMDWEADEESAPLGMLREGFGESRIKEYIDSDKTRAELYEDAVAFLAKWGVKATIVS